MRELKRVTKAPEFPENELGLQRGTMLEALDPICKTIGVDVGQSIPIGWDGEYVRCQGCTWSVEQIVQEISERHWWRISGQIMLEDAPAGVQALFHAVFEQIEIVPEETAE